MKNKVSVIVPVYNVEKYLDRCLNSLIAQSYSNIEIIIVNDGSTDGSKEVCEKYSGIDPRIKLLSQHNQGLSQARNTAMKHMKGDYIVFVDSDDYVENTYIEDLYNALVKDNADISVCGFYNQFNDKTIESRTESRILNKTEAVRLLVEDIGMPSYVWNKLYKRELWEGILFPVGKKFEDIYVMHKVFLRAQVVSVIDKPLYHYMRRGDSITGISKLTNTEETFSALRSRRNDLIGTEFYHTACLTELQKMRATLCELDNIKETDQTQFKDRLNKDIRKLYKEERMYISYLQKVKFELFFSFPKLYSTYLHHKTLMKVGK